MMPDNPNAIPGTATLEMPRYRCHKIVHALKIARCESSQPAGGLMLHFVNMSFAPIARDPAWCAAHGPGAGGYYVVYDDGYTSYSPAEAFEGGYTLIERGNAFDFGEAIRQLKTGARVERLGWNGRGMFIKLQVRDEHSKMTLSYIFMSTVDGDLVPWLASQTDMLSDDWIIHGSD